jgi:hypothetical protein
MGSIAPILPAIRWGRWLNLEKALEQAMATGDLLFAAVILRSLGEEVLRLRALEISWVDSRPSSQEIRAWAAAVFISIEPFVQDHSTAKHEKAEHFDLSLPHADDNEIRTCMKALNDYIHPNYGSHILALYPESAEGSRIILDAFEKICGAFLMLHWATDSQPLEGIDMGSPYVADFSKVVWRLKSRLMNKLKQHAQDRYSIKDFSPISFSDWLSSEESSYSEALNAPEVENVLMPLRDAILGMPVEGANPIRCADPWRLSSAKLVFELAIARRGEQLLREQFPAGTPSDQTSREWFLFAAQSFEVLIMTTALKIAFFRVQMVRQIVDQNLIGIAACMRSILEHFAISEWLLERLGDHWNEVKKKTQSSGGIPMAATKKFESDLTRLLVGTMGTVERPVPWAQLREGVNVTSAVASAFKDAAHFLSEYDWSSAALHGRLMRSVELCFPNQDYVDNILFRGIRCLEWVCSRDLEGGHLRESFQIWSYLKNLVRVLQGNDQLRRHSLIQAVGAVTKLKHGRDYSGTGSSVSDPIVFRGPLNYYLAFDQYCQQEQLDRATRRPEFISHVLYDVVQQGDREIWFKAPGPA